MRAWLILLACAGARTRLSPTHLKTPVSRAPLPWRLRLEDVERCTPSLCASAVTLASLEVHLDNLGVRSKLTASGFIVVAAPASSHTHGLSVLETVGAYIEPTLDYAIELVDAVPLFVCTTARVFRCCDSEVTAKEAWISRLVGTSVWMVVGEECGGATKNPLVSEISRAQFIELQETAGNLLHVRYTERGDQGDDEASSCYCYG